jgi:hypothetical protein
MISNRLNVSMADKREMTARIRTAPVNRPYHESVRLAFNLHETIHTAWRNPSQTEALDDDFTLAATPVPELGLPPISATESAKSRHPLEGSAADGIHLLRSAIVVMPFRT